MPISGGGGWRAVTLGGLVCLPLGCCSGPLPTTGLMQWSLPRGCPVLGCYPGGLVCLPLGGCSCRCCSGIYLEGALFGCHPGGRGCLHWAGAVVLPTTGQVQWSFTSRVAWLWAVTLGVWFAYHWAVTVVGLLAFHWARSVNVCVSRGVLAEMLPRTREEVHLQDLSLP